MSTSQCHVYMLSHVRLFMTPWTVAHQASLFMGFSRQEYKSGLPFPPPGDILHRGLEPKSPASTALQVDSLPLSHQENPGSQFTWQHSGWKLPAFT